MATVQGYVVLEVLAEDRYAVLSRARRGEQTFLVRSPAREYPTWEEIAKLRYGAGIARALQLPGVLQVLDLETRNGGAVVVMKDFPGRPLRSILAERRLDPEEAVRVALALVRTIGELHNHHVIHKNLEPGSVLVDVATGQVEVINFDIASRLTRDNPAITSAYRLEGNLAYISPEQTGRMNRSVDYRTDLYSLGVVLYEMLTGQVPFQATDPLSLVHSHIAVAPTPPHELRPNVPRALSSVALKLLAKNAEDRYQSAYGVIADLKECLRRLADPSAPAELVPGIFDVPATFRIPQKLYGREAEGRLLVSAFDRVSAGARELVLVAGYSGVGKSALVSEIHKPIVKRRGAFSAGKFDQLQSSPYSALIQAFQGLIRELLTESEDRVAALKARLLEALGSNGHVITSVIPEVELIIGPQQPVPPLGPSESGNRFNLVFQQFIGALARPESPAAIFLDDLQWADSGSLGLIQMLLGDDGTRHLLVIGAYRDNEVHGAHPLFLALAEIRKGTTKVSEIALAPLGRDDVTSLIVDTLDRPDDGELHDLADLVFQRTGGNPFFVGQLLTSLHDRRLLTFDTDAGRWRWELRRIREEGVTDSVAQLMAEKIRKLPEAAQRAMKLAACIGGSFDLETLSVVSERSSAETAAALWEAVEEGLMLPIGDAYKYVGQAGSVDVGPEHRAIRYQFLHDRVREAAYAQIEDDSKKQVHLRVGRLLLRSTPPDKLDARLFDIVGQLALAAELIDTPEEKHRLAELSLAAGEKAKASTAYEAALRYLKVGTDQLGDRAWETSYPLAYALFRQRAECDYLVGHHDEAEAAFDRVLREGRSNAQRREVHSRKMLLYMSRGKYLEATNAGLDGLRLDGVDVDLAGDLGAAGEAEMALLQQRLAGRSIADLAATPDAQDADARAHIRLLSTVLGYGAYTNPGLFQLLAMKMVNVTLERGAAAGSALGFVTYAMRVGAALGDWPSAYEFGRVAIALSDRLDDADAGSSVHQFFGAFVNPWCRRMQSSRPHFEKAYLGCLESGAIFMAAVAGMQGIILGFHGGEELRGLDERARRLAEHLHRLKQADQANIIAAHIASIHRLATGAPAGASEPWLDEQQLGAKLAHFPMGAAVAACVFFVTAYLMGDHERAAPLAQQAEELLPSAFGIVLQAEFCFFQSLFFLALPPAESADERARRRATVEANRDKLEHWALGCPENFLHEVLLVRAELARVDGQDDVAMALYDRAVELTAEADLPSASALANELAGTFHLSRGRRKIARAYLSDARYAYAAWGATAKAAALEAQHRDLLPRQGAAAGDGSTSGAALDLTTVMKASQAISGEIVLEDLLKKLTVTLLESAGAQRGVLMLVGEHEAVVEAQKGSADGAETTVGLAAPGRRADLATSLVRYVERTSQTVVLGDAGRSAQFAADPYIARTRPKSILCMPVIKQKQLVGVLYLENNLVTDAFTPDRCEVLELLAAQAAISLENAKVYDTLDQRVKARTSELNRSNEELLATLTRLKETQKQLIVQEKLASLGALTSGIAHEIKNPLNFVNNFAELSVTLVGELLDEIGRQAPRLDEEGAASLRDIAGDIKDSATKINEHGKRADGIVQAMLEHSRMGVGERRAVDVNTLVKEYLNLAYQGFRAQDPAFVAVVEAEYDAALPSLHIAPQDLGRVLLNLANNAFYAVRARHKQLGEGFAPTVRVSTHATPDAIVMRVRDNGTGIPASARDRVFNPFFTTKRAGEGSGLGLSISYDIVVQGNGGALAFETEDGAFTEFTVTLPNRASEPAPPAEEAP